MAYGYLKTIDVMMGDTFKRNIDCNNQIPKNILDIYFRLDNNGKLFIDQALFNNHNIISLNIPSWINYKKVKSIDVNALKDAYYLEFLRIPSTVEYIPSELLIGCKHLVIAHIHTNELISRDSIILGSANTTLIYHNLDNITSSQKKLAKGTEVAMYLSVAANITRYVSIINRSIR